MRFCLIICSCILWLRLFVIFRVLGAPCLAVIGLIAPCSVSMSLTFSLHSSTGLKPVSRLIVSLSASGWLAFAISICSFSFVGSLMFLASGS